MADLTDQPEMRLERFAGAAARPLSELLDCPQHTGTLLTGAVQNLEFEAGQIVFHQDDPTKGLYVVASGEFARKTQCLQMRVTLGLARPGDLLELAAALGDAHHTYSLSAVTRGSLLLLPIESLHRAFESYPPLRMRLLEELAREVSRAYVTCCQTRVTPARRHSGSSAQA